MSKLYASIDADASKTQATRRAHHNITTHTRGWDSGVKVHGYIDAEDRAVFEVYETGGSHDSTARRLLARIVDGELAEVAPAPPLKVTVVMDGPAPR